VDIFAKIKESCNSSIINKSENGEFYYVYPFSTYLISCSCSISHGGGPEKRKENRDLQRGNATSQKNEK